MEGIRLERGGCQYVVEGIFTESADLAYNPDVEIPGGTVEPDPPGSISLDISDIRKTSRLRINHHFMGEQFLATVAAWTQMQQMGLKKDRPAEFVSGLMKEGIKHSRAHTSWLSLERAWSMMSVGSDLMDSRSLVSQRSETAPSSSR